MSGHIPYNKIVPKGTECGQQAQGGCESTSGEEVDRMRITFHIGKYTVTIVIRETHREENSRHSDQ